MNTGTLLLHCESVESKVDIDYRIHSLDKTLSIRLKRGKKADFSSVHWIQGARWVQGVSNKEYDVDSILEKKYARSFFRKDVISLLLWS